MFDYSQPQAEDALEIAQRLQSADFTAYFAGGCVRDALLGRAPKDFDVATDATPEKVRELFGRRRTLAFGVSFGSSACSENQTLQLRWPRFAAMVSTAMGDGPTQSVLGTLKTTPCVEILPSTACSMTQLLVGSSTM